MDYSKYRYSVMEIIKYTGLCILVLFTISYFFYRSLAAFFLSIILIPFYLILKRKELIRKRKKRLADEFSETLFSVSANMMSGYSVENAFKESVADIERFYGKNSLMAAEIRLFEKGLAMNMTIEELMADLAKRSEVEDILVFSQVFETAKRNGSNLKEVLYETATSVRTKMSVEKEIDVLVSEKMFELRIMELVPIFIIGYIGITSEGYFDALYHNLTGIIFMSVCLAVYITSIFIGKRIVTIDV